VWPTVTPYPPQLERVDWIPSREHPPDLSTWPYTIPAVAQLIEAGGLEIPSSVTFLVGENGSGKSTLVEALAAIYPRRGFATPYADTLGPADSSEDSPLLYHLRARTHRQASPAGFFLRAEAMHHYLGQIDSDPDQARAWGGEQRSACTSWMSPRRPSRSGRASHSWRCSTRCARRGAR
jgi:predicted ATPase